MVALESKEQNSFESWLQEVYDICFEKSGLSYRGLPNQNLKVWFQGGMIPEIASFQIMQSFDAEDVYYQEFDDFTDADPGL
jgi:hypothetical protein